MWRPLLLLFSLFCCTGNASYSQATEGKYIPDRPLRIEIPVRSVNETYRILPCGANGLIMFFRSQEVVDGARINWYFTMYDTNLRQVWVKSVPLFEDQEFRFSQFSYDTLAILFVQAEKSKKPVVEYEILRIIPQSGMLILNTGQLDDGVVVETFGVRSGRAWLGVNHKGATGKIVNIDLKHGFNNAFTLGTGSQIKVHWMQPDSASPAVSALVSRQVSKKTTEYFLVRYDTNGRIMREVPIGMKLPERTIPHASVVSSGDGTELLLGSYGQGVAGSAKKYLPGEEATGLFASPVRNGSQKSISFYNFLELKHANEIVGEEDIMNLKKKALKKKKSLGEYSLDFSLLMHNILIINDQRILVAEIFSPQYHTENFTDFDFYGRPYTNSYSVFDGYRFFHAVVAGFDQEGKLLWDNSVEIRNLVSPDLSAKVVVHPYGNDLVLAYVSDGKIGSKIIHESEVVEKLDFSTLDLMHSGDKLVSENRSGMVHWYDNYFLGYGYQELKNVALLTDNKRMVFYFSKLLFEK